MFPHCGQWRVPKTTPFCRSFFSLGCQAASHCFIRPIKSSPTLTYMLFWRAEKPSDTKNRHLANLTLGRPLQSPSWLDKGRRIPWRAHPLPPLMPHHWPMPSDDKRGPFSLRAPHQPSPADNPKGSKTVWPDPTCLRWRNHIARPLERGHRRTSMFLLLAAKMYRPRAR